MQKLSYCIKKGYCNHNCNIILRNKNNIVIENKKLHNSPYDTVRFWFYILNIFYYYNCSIYIIDDFSYNKYVFAVIVAIASLMAI